ncbi:MAG TPA: lipid II flippase MurJ, partial [Limnochordales bacterium]
GMSMVIFPVMARLAALGDLQEFGRTLSTGLRTVLFITVPSAVGLVALGEPIVRLLFEVGAFGPEDTATTAYALLYFGVGVFAISSVQVLTRAYYSLQDTVTPVKIGVLTVVTNTGLSLVFLRFTALEHGGLALAFSIAAIVQMAAQLAVLRRRLGPRLHVRAVAGTFARASLAAAVMFPVAREVSLLVGQHVNLAATGGRLAQVLAGMAAGAAVYGAAALLLRMEELAMAWDALRRMVRRSS